MKFVLSLITMLSLPILTFAAEEKHQPILMNKKMFR